MRYLIVFLFFSLSAMSSEYKVFSTTDYLNKNDAALIFKMKKDEWNNIVKNKAKNPLSRAMGYEDQGLQWWEVVSPGVAKMIHAGFGLSSDKPFLITLMIVFQDQSQFTQENHNSLYKTMKKEWLPEFKVVSRYNKNSGLKKNETESIFIFSENK